MCSGEWDNTKKPRYWCFGNYEEGCDGECVFAVECNKKREGKS